MKIRNKRRLALSREYLEINIIIYERNDTWNRHPRPRGTRLHAAPPSHYIPVLARPSFLFRSGMERSCLVMISRQWDLEVSGRVK